MIQFLRLRLVAHRVTAYRVALELGRPTYLFVTGQRVDRIGRGAAQAPVKAVAVRVVEFVGVVVLEVDGRCSIDIKFILGVDLAQWGARTRSPHRL